MIKKQTLNEFIERSKIKHNNKFDYSLVIHNGTNINVTIICPIHGSFEQTPGKHLRGQGCAKCHFDTKRMNTNDFKIKANKIHLNKYDYSVTEYIKSKIHVNIKCPIHGVFSQTPYNHLSGKGCNKCKGGVKQTLDEFILKANLKHNGRYNYSDVNYINGETKINILCLKHGIFKQPSNTHLRGAGCPKCASEINNDRRKIPFDNFVYRANIKHKNRFSYVESTYKYGSIITDIICPIHGVFQQKPTNHLMGQSCPNCSSSIGESKIREYLIENKIEFTPQKRFSKCRDKKPLPFDFYLPKYNTCIEYNGIQHYEPVTHFGGEEKYNKLIKNDNIKKDFCCINGINLLVIKYDENIVEKLRNFSTS